MIAFTGDAGVFIGVELTGWRNSSDDVRGIESWWVFLYDVRYLR